MRIRSLAPLGLLVASLPVHAYQLIGATWNTERGPSEYALHPDGSDDITDGSDLEAVRQAFENWSCIEGSRFRFRERTDVEGVKSDSLSDGINSVFWDETNEFALGPATLGVNIGNGGQGQARNAAVIIFNGYDHTWSTDDAGSAVDVGSIAIHEIGHWLGLAHACTDMSESNCSPIDEAVMTPAYTSGTYREPFADDINGLLEMYAQDPSDNSTCEGPFRIGEYCACDAECANGLSCVPQEDGSQVCAKQCDSENTGACGPGFNCVLGQRPDDNSPAPGACRAQVAGTAAPPGTACVNDGYSCGQFDCTSSGAAGGGRVCFQGCLEDSDCPDGYACTGIQCLLDTDALSVTCPSGDGDGDGDGDGCACATPSDALPVGGFALAAFSLVLSVSSRRRRR